MKKYFITAIILAAGLVFLPGRAAAQYNIMSGYNSTYYAIEAAKARSRAAAVHGHRSSKRRIVRKKRVRRHSNRVSRLENFVPPTKTILIAPKSVIV